MPRAIKKRAKKKGSDEIDVQEKLADIKDTFARKQKTVIMYGLGALAVIVVVAGFFIYRSTMKEQARQLEYEAYKVFYNEYSSGQTPPKERFQKALDLFKRAYAKHNSPRALLYIANSYYALGDYDNALSQLVEFTGKYSDNKDLLPLAYKEMADIQLMKGNKEEALKTLDKLYRLPGNIYKDFALVESARILESEGKHEDAVAKYREITEKFKGSPFYDEAKAKLGEKKEG